MTTLNAASRDAFAEAERRLLAELDGATAETAAGLGEDLSAVARLLGRESGLRRAIADASAEAATREGLIRAVLGEKVGERAFVVLAAVVTARWSSPRELVHGIVLLGRTALLIGAEKDTRLDAVEDELFRLGRIVANQPDLERLLADPAGNVGGKTTLVRGLLSDKVEPVTLSLVEDLLHRWRGGDVVAEIDELAGAAAARRERSVAYVRTAIALTEAQQTRLIATLSRIYARQVALHLEVDPTVRGGLLIRIGDEVIDGTATGRLAALGRRLAG
ncbi:F0F1 ATP synthase subunit delta [Actinoalloteichus hymeniacidonis]|uniref:ATP synthase subunit delta n=1 Tax=Actinoalloteichus hymeniacidonis TaxID=340345 RepID=A0AAC9MXT8_9PSEU|nr:F0F1 ATP synthase subunit delta [Actinoalloteichus hymeniacidonis]AOS62282.1 ATP synthase F1 subcomplex delta subunit [Actinoalloteichus hymeniacidonis]MBB5909692.1 F-type H+-transporting ATPase subunit delta [Actinoalloteichus hymeniacidonis]